VRLKVLPRAKAAVSDLFSAVPGDPSPRPPAPAVEALPYVARLNAHLVRRPGRLVMACLATVLGPAVVAQATSVTVEAVVETAPAAPTAGPPPAPVPGHWATWVPLATEAAAGCPGLPAAVLVAIAQVESRLGLLTSTSPAGAEGPMQFLPATWAHYGADGDGDGTADVMNPVDAVHGAARLLCANGGADPDRLASAVWNYNHSDAYVGHVLRQSQQAP
jgi:soluble lytic murein transglycosylase-like protein